MLYTITHEQVAAILDRANLPDSIVHATYRQGFALTCEFKELVRFVIAAGAILDNADDMFGTPHTGATLPAGRALYFWPHTELEALSNEPGEFTRELVA